MKLDQVEMRALRGLMNRYRPDLYLDIHVTDGMDYQYDLTYGYNGEDGAWSRSPAIAAWLDRVLKPAMNERLEAEGHIPGELVFGLDDDEPRAGLTDGGLGERYSNGWGAVAHIPTILIENHSLKPHAQRVLATYVFLQAALERLAAEGQGLRTAIEADRALRPAQLPANFVQATQPACTRPFKGMRYDTYDSPASGRREIRWLGQPDPEPWALPYYPSHATLALDRPAAYWVPGYRDDLIDRLALHGVAMERLVAPRTVAVEMLRLQDPQIAREAAEGHVAITVAEATPERRDWTFAAGSVRITTDQPLGDLVILLLEPQSSESFFAWGMIPEVLTRVEYIEPYAIAPLADRMLAADPALRARFEARLAADSPFAGDPKARLAWFYERTPFYDERYLLYPIARAL